VPSAPHTYAYIHKEHEFTHTHRPFCLLKAGIIASLTFSTALLRATCMHTHTYIYIYTHVTHIVMYRCMHICMHMYLGCCRLLFLEATCGSQALLVR